MFKTLLKLFSPREAAVAILAFLIPFLLVSGTRWSRLDSHFAVQAPDGIDLYTREPMPMKEAITQLEQKGAIKRAEVMNWVANVMGWHHVPAGHYRLEGFYSYDSVLTKLGRGIQDPVEITILPSTTRGRLSRHLASEMAFDSADVHKLFQDSTYLAQYGFTKEDLMGRMLPDTYRVYWTWSPKRVFKRVLDQFDQVVAQRYAARLDSIGYSLNEILTLASIVQWEAQQDDEKARISGLYWNRLKKHMYLQADPTVLYAIGERRRLLFKDYRIDDPFNTYQHFGLPPGPITNPDLESIKAALFPEQHDYLFMVATPQGHHVFTKTFKAHKRESAKWRKWIREQYRIKREREQQEQTLHPGGKPKSGSQ